MPKNLEKTGKIHIDFHGKSYYNSPCLVHKFQIFLWREGYFGCMEQIIKEFISYLHNVKMTSANTEQSYQRDLKKLVVFLSGKGINKPSEVTEELLNEYIEALNNDGFKAATISRSIASIKAFYQYCLREGYVSKDPAAMLKAPKIEKKFPGILTMD